MADTGFCLIIVFQKDWILFLTTLLSLSDTMIKNYLGRNSKLIVTMDSFLEPCVCFARVVPGAPNVNFRRISVRKTIWDLEFSEHLL